MGKSKGDYKRRNPVTREMIERHRNAVHADRRRKILDKMSVEALDNLDPDDYIDSVDPAGNVIISYRRTK